MRRKLLIGLAVVVVAATAGGAYAATQTNSNPRQAFLNDVAKRLGVSPSKLQAAVTGALMDRLNADVKAGRLTQAQANKIEQRIARGRGLPFGLALGPPRRFGPAPPGALRFGVRGPGGPFKAAAQYLGLSPAQLINDLAGGKTLAQVAGEQHKSLAGLEQTLTNAAKARIDRLSAAGVITKAQAQRLERRLAAKIDRLVNRGLAHGLAQIHPRFAPGPPPSGFMGPGGPGGPGGPAGAGGPAGGGPVPAPPPGA